LRFSRPFAAMIVGVSYGKGTGGLEYWILNQEWIELCRPGQAKLPQTPGPIK